MWRYNRKTTKWEKQLDSLVQSEFNFYKQELEKIRYYSKCLSGTSYTRLNNFDNIYDITLYKSDANLIINSQSSIYASSSATQSFTVTPLTLTDYDDYLVEYGYTVKNLFTPQRTINDLNKNYYYVDVATTVEIDINTVTANYIIDGVRLLSGHRVLVKDQKTFVTLANNVDPNNYFTNNYYISTSDTSNTTYYFYNDINGVYEYRNNRLNRLTDLDIYENALKYSVAVKLGTNREKEFHLSRLKNGHFPISSLNENIEFVEHHSWILRNKVEYQNIFEINYYDILHSATSSYGTSSIVPNRDIFIGQFGSILSLQDGNLNYVQNLFKVELRGISRTSTHYWICGDDGTLLKVNKLDFKIEKIDLDTRNKFLSIDFTNDLRGIVVGQFNTIFYTLDGGFTWKKILIEDYNEYSYNKVLFINNFVAYIGGTNGFFTKMSLSSNNWILTKISPIKYIDFDTTFGVADSINDMYYEPNLNWSLSYTTTTTQSIASIKSGLVVVGDSGLIFVHDLNSFSSQYDQIFLESTNSIGSVNAINKRSSLYNIAADNLYNFTINSFSQITTASNVIQSPTQIYLTGSYNSIALNNVNDLLIVGSDSFVQSSSSTNSTTDLTTIFYTKYKSKFPVLDYDVASKLNFYDNDSNYRMPITQSSTTNLTGSISKVYISNIPNEFNWLSYYKDSIKEFKYNSANYIDGNKVQFSTNFDVITASQLNTITISATNGYVTNQLLPIINLAPTFNGFTHGSTGLTGSTYSYNLFLYDDLMILHHTSSLTSSIGDVFSLSSSIVSDEFILNNKLIIGNSEYLYFYTNFNGNIINNLVNTTYSITLINRNKFSTELELETNFNNYHLINWGYSIDYATSSNNKILSFDTKYNNHTAYYNLQSQIVVESNNSITSTISSNTMSLVYQNLYLNFGYTPTYNLLDYLSNIDSIAFSASKTFDIMPKYYSIPVGTSNNFANITGNINGYYKISFNPSLYFEYNTLLKNTFIDINVTDGISVVSTEKLLIIDKYQDSNTGYYIIELNKQINIGALTSFTSIDIISRNTLLQISEDLGELNNIHLNQRLKEYGINSYTTLENEIKNRFWTDSYSKVLLSDSDVKEKVTAILYYDNKNELSLNVINTDNKVTNDIIRTYINSGKLAIELSSRHKLNTGDSLLLFFTGTNSSTSGINNPTYNGIRTVSTVIDDFNIEINQQPSTTWNPDPGYIQYYLNDPYFNYEPVDILDIGIDAKSKQSIMISEENVKLDGITQSLVNIDFSKFRFKMVDGLNLEILSEKYGWFLEAEVEDAVIGENSNGLVWYSGIWHCGRWFGGTWYSGEWRDGTWYDGVWNSVQVQLFGSSAKVSLNIQLNDFSKWFGGKWIKGTWNSGLWFEGRHYDGTWNNGEWFGGTWDSGTWNLGFFKGGIWIDGKWNDGIFSCDADQSYWIDGDWNGGDFSCGIWYNGTFDQRNGKKSRFGTNATNERKAIWFGGSWINGQFHSRLNIDKSTGNPIPSLYHGYSIWYCGIWNNGEWFGGTCYQINWKLGNWYEGILYDIPVIGILNGYPGTTKVTLNGQFYFNRGDEIYIIDDNNSTPYNYLGELNNPKNYLIQDVFVDNVNSRTDIYINTSSGASISLTDTNNRVVSIFKKANWYNGVWFNGIFDGDNFKGGVWFNGIFRQGNWLS